METLSLPRRLPRPIATTLVVETRSFLSLPLDFDESRANLVSTHSSQKCGGTYRINIYQKIASTTTTTSTPAATPTSSLYTSLGCYADPGGNRQLTEASSSSASMSESRLTSSQLRATENESSELSSRPFPFFLQRPICAPAPASTLDIPMPEPSVSYFSSSSVGFGY